MLRVSIDAATAETYKKMRHSDKFEIVEENIKKFVEIKQQLGLVLPQVRISFCKTYLNSNEENQFIEKDNLNLKLIALIVKLIVIIETLKILVIALLL